MKRRDFLKFGLVSVLAAAGGSGFLKIYKRTTGVRKIFEYPDPILRKVSAPVNAIDDKIVALSRQMIATLRYYSLIGFFSKAFIFLDGGTEKNVFCSFIFSTITDCS